MRRHTANRRTPHGWSREGGREGGGRARQTTYLPELDVIPALALVIKAIYPIDGGTLVVAAEDIKVLGVLDFVGEEEADGFQGLFAAVHVVAVRGREGGRERGREG